MIWLLLAVPPLLLGCCVIAAALRGTACDRAQELSLEAPAERPAFSLAKAASVFRLY